MNPPPATTTVTGPRTKPTSPCTNCGSQNSWVLHHVRFQSQYRRLCTSCTLLLHPSSFCPSCLSFYSALPSAANRLTCTKCSSFTHSHCAPSSPPTPFLCLPCTRDRHNFSFFRVDPHNPAIDRNAASALLCAAKISAESMTKAAALARDNAVSSAREAAQSKKRAREALQHLYFLETKEKLIKREKEDDERLQEEDFTSTVTHH